MRGAWGKPYGLAARVAIGTILFSVRTKELSTRDAMEGWIILYILLALRRGKNKFAGR